ncbi:DUF6894 family protein [Rhizobium leguminosarum]|uniref:DUF6894 family protein n=1 Tax=Rhizobium TaxID=379 RepID=UPI0002FCA407
MANWSFSKEQTKVIVSGTSTPAVWEGTELATIEDARQQAVQDARALMSQQCLREKTCRRERYTSVTNREPFF